MNESEQEMSHPPPDRHLMGVGGIVLREENSVLLIKPSYGPAKGLWMIPGGYVDTGENFKETIKREVMEETGIEINPINIVSVRLMTRGGHFEDEPSQINDLYVVLKCNHVEGEPYPNSSEVSEVSFHDLDWAIENQSVAIFTRQLLKHAAKAEEGLYELPPADPKRLEKLKISKYSLYVPKK